jgi:hypothetical protein
MTLTEIENLRDTLCKELDKRAKAVKEAEGWYDGNHPIPDPPPGTLASVDADARLAFNKMCQLGVMNWMPPVVDAPSAKCIVNGMRFGESSMSSDPKLQRIWQRNQLDADHQLSVVDALKVGSAPIILWRGPDGKAEITIEDPAQVIVAYEAGSRRKRRAALKRWKDEDGYSYATLYTPDWIYKWKSKTASSLVDASGSALSASWDVRQPSDEAWPLANPYGRVTVYELRANPTSRAAAYGGGTPEFAKVITDQKRTNKHMFLMLTTEDAQSFRQRWATDWDYPTKTDGTPDREAMLRFAASTIANFSSMEEGQPVKVGEFAQAEFRPFVDIFGLEVKHIASITATPPHAFLLGDMVNVAADSLARIDTAFAARITRHTTQFGETFEEILRDALLIEGDEQANDYSLSIDWIAPEQRTATEQTVVARAYKDMGAPDEAVWAQLPDVDRVEAHRWKVQEATEQLLSPDPAEEPVPA